MILDTQDLHDLHIENSKDRQDIDLTYHEVWLCEDPMQRSIIRMYQKWMLSSM